MAQDVLVNEEKDAGAELIDRLNKSRPVELAFWMKPAVRNRWFLYLVLKGIGHSNVEVGYMEIIQQLKEMRTPHLGSSQVKLLQSDVRLARDVMEVYRRFTVDRPMNYPGYYLGGMTVEGAYLYPLPSASAANQTPG